MSKMLMFGVTSTQLTLTTHHKRFIYSLRSVGGGGLWCAAVATDASFGQLNRSKLAPNWPLWCLLYSNAIWPWCWWVQGLFLILLVNGAIRRQALPKFQAALSASKKCSCLWVQEFLQPRRASFGNGPLGYRTTDELCFALAPSLSLSSPCPK